MRYFEYIAYVELAKEHQKFETFLLEMGYGALVPYSAENWSQICEIIFAVAHSDEKTLVGQTSARAFAKSYKLPERTVQRWLLNEEHRKTAIYVRELLGFAIIGNIEKIEEDI